MKKNKTGNIYTIFYRTHNAILTYAPIFNELLDGIGQVCREEGYTLKIEQYLEKQQDLQTYIEDLLVSNCLGIILIGTEMGEEAGRQFLASQLPVVILDSYFESLNCNCVLINNTQLIRPRIISSAAWGNSPVTSAPPTLCAILMNARTASTRR